MNNAQGIPLNCGTFVGSGIPVYSFTKPIFGGGFLSISTQQLIRTTSSSSSSLVTTKDVQNTVTSGANTITDYIVTVNPSSPDYYASAVISKNSGIILGPNSLGIASGVSVGSTVFFASATSDSNIFATSSNISVTQTFGTVNTVFNSYVSGSLSKHVGDSLDARLVGLTPANAKPIFTTQNHATPSYVRNTGCWTSGIDMTCISPWNSAGGATRGGTLISPRHILFCAHYQIDNGSTIRFVDANNNIVTRTMVTKLTHPSYSPYYPDISIGVLDSDVPNSIGFAKILPSNWASYLPSLSSNRRIPCLVLDQEEKALIAELYSLSTTSILLNPSNATRLSYYENMITGDSGNPVFLIINGQLVIITVITYGGAGSGTSVVFHKDAINTMMATLGGGYSLTEVSLSGFNSY